MAAVWASGDLASILAACALAALLALLPLLPPLGSDVLYLVRKAWPGSFVSRSLGRLSRPIADSGLSDAPARTEPAAARVSVLDVTIAIGVVMAASAVVGVDERPPAVLLLGIAVPILLLIAFDLRYRVLPDMLTLPLAALGLLSAALQVAPAGPDFVSAAIGCFGTGAALWALQHGFRTLRGVDGLGGGDVKLAAAMGAWLGPVGCAIAIAAAALGALAAELALALARGRLDPKRRIPFGAYLSGAFWLALTSGVGS